MPSTSFSTVRFRSCPMVSREASLAELFPRGIEGLGDAVRETDQEITRSQLYLLDFVAAIGKQAQGHPTTHQPARLAGNRPAKADCVRR